MKAAVLCTMLLLCTGACVLGQEEDAAVQQAYKHPLTDPPPAADNVETVSWFPNHPSKQFPAGEDIDVIVGFHNGEDEALNVTAIMGALLMDNTGGTGGRMYIQNFTFQTYPVTLAPGQEASLRYTFQPYAMLPAKEFDVALTVFYNSLTTGFSTTFFNQTIDIVEPAKLVDTELLSLYGLLTAGLAAGGYFLYRFVSGLGFVKKSLSGKAKAKKPEPVRKASNQEEWLQGTFYDQAQKAKLKREASLRAKQDKGQ